MRTNAWITLENNLALTWWDYYQWFIGGQEGPEPPLDDFGKKAIRKLVDIDFAFKCFKKANILSREWRMLSVYDVTENQLEAGYNQYGDAAQGGDYAVAGYWEWRAGDPMCALLPTYQWRPNQVIEYMPDVCDDPDCTTQSPATEVWDVNLLAGQPPRLLPPPVAQIDLVALVAYLVSEGWQASTTANRVEVVYNGTSYTRTKQWLAQCDFSNVPGPLAFDVQQGLALQGFCIAP